MSLCTCRDGMQVQGLAGVSQGKATALQAIRALLHTRGPLGLMKGYWVSGWGVGGEWVGAHAGLLGGVGGEWVGPDEGRLGEWVGCCWVSA